MVLVSDPSSQEPSAIRVAIITGTVEGVGEAIAYRFAEEGLNVVISDTADNEDALQRISNNISQGKGGGKCTVVVCNPFEEGDVLELVHTTVGLFGRLDVLVANAALGKSSPIVETPAEEWDQVIQYNLRSTFLAFKHAAIQMIKQGWGGRIIGASSISGKQAAAEWAAYSASKFAIRGLTQAAAAEWKKHGITVNTYAPGAIDIPECIWKIHQVQDKRAREGLPPVDFPVVPPKDIAGLVSYLIKDEAKFITGQSLSINGGMFYD